MRLDDKAMDKSVWGNKNTVEDRGMDKRDTSTFYIRRWNMMMKL